MKKIFIDCGTNKGQGLEKIYNMSSLDDTWEIHCFEVNSKCIPHIEENEIYRNHPASKKKLINKGVWIEDCNRYLTEEYCPTEKDYIGGATNILEDDFLKPDYILEEYINIEACKVECIDFSKYVLSQVKPEDLLVIKMDIEGAEYPVLQSMIETGAISLVNTLFVEWHNRLIKNKYDERFLKQKIFENNIKLYNWD